MIFHMRPLFAKIKKTTSLNFSLLSLLFIIIVIFYFEQASKKDNLEPQDFTVRLNTLLYRLKPWCIDQEKVAHHESAGGEIELESYCACVVGKIDQNFRIDRFDLTSNRYRRTHPYVTIQLQSFRQHCFEEIK